MNAIKGFGRCLTRKSIKSLLFVGKYPMEVIEMLSATFLLLFAMYTLMPTELVPTPSAYDNNLVKLIFGIAMATPAVALLVHAFTSKSMDDFVYIKQRSRRKALFWVSLTWFHIAILRAVAIAVFPPIFLAFLLASLITIVCYIRLGR